MLFEALHSGKQGERRRGHRSVLGLADNVESEWRMHASKAVDPAWSLVLFSAHRPVYKST